MPADPILFVPELLFTIIAVVFCFLIYFKTKELYDLTKYEGIKYFRQGFLFFGCSYILRFLLLITFLSVITLDIVIPKSVVIAGLLMPLGYLSSVGLFYLLFSVMWKRFNRKAIFVGHSVAILLSVTSFITRSPLILLSLQAILLMFLVIMGFVYKGGKNISQVRVLYLLTSFLWLIHLLTIGIRRPLFSLGVELFFQAMSIVVFVILYRKILKWTV